MHAAWAVRDAGAGDSIQPVRKALIASMRPASQEWFGRRLTVLWTMFMAGRDTDPGKMAIWLAETAAHLADLPHDIVAHAIDQAIRKSPHGFIPSVGEIRKFADPLADERQVQIERLGRVAEALRNPSMPPVLSEEDAKAMMPPAEFEQWMARKRERTAA